MVKPTISLSLRSPCFLISALALCCCAFLLGCNRDPNSRKLKYFGSGSRYLQQGDFAAAAIQLTNAVQIDPGYAAAHFELAEAYLGMRRFQDAYRELQRTLELEPGNNKALLDLGALEIAGGAYDQIQPIASRMLQNDPRSSDAHLLLAELNQAQRNTEIALREINQAIALDAGQPKFYVQLATLQLSDQKKDAAAASLGKALEIDPKCISAIQAYLALDESTGQVADEEQRLRQLIELQPKAVEPREKLALLWYSQNRKGEAEQLMIQAKKDLALDGDHYRVLAEYYEKVGETGKALVEFASLAKEHPKDLRTKEDYIYMLLSQHRFDEADKLTDAILQENPEDNGAQIIRGAILNTQHKYAAASAILGTAVSNAPENPEGHYQFGLALRQVGYEERAEEEWHRAAKLQPHMISAQLGLAQIARAKNDRNLLKDSADEIVRTAPSDPRGYILRSEAEAAFQQIAPARLDLERAIQLAPNNPAGYNAMGDFLRTQHNNHNNNDARQYYEQALERDPRNSYALSQIVSVLAAEKRAGQAIERVQAQLLKAPNGDDIYALLGRLQAATKDWTAATASLQKALQLNPGNLDAVISLSKVEIAQGNADEALATAYKSIHENQKNVAAYYFVGTMEEMRGDSKKAELAYRQALQIEPNYAPVANNLAYLLLQTGGSTDEALSLAELARQAMPDSPRTADTLAWACYKKGVYSSRAKELLQEALQRAPEDATYHFHIGMVYQQQRDVPNAKKHLQRALQISPSSPEAAEIRRVLEQLRERTTGRVQIGSYVVPVGSE